MAYTSSFHGNIQEIPEIAVDNFENMDRSAYFLSHYHSDHICGLYNSYLYKNLVSKDTYIYTSEVTAEIIRNSDDGKLIDRVVGLRIGSSVVTLKQAENDNEVLLKVTLLPAGHCFGSVMFLFTLDNRNILYTGDFRISRNSVSKYGHLHKSNGDPVNIDALYIDTTFQNVASFPTREETVADFINEIDKWLRISDKHCVALHTSANYGYEFVFNEIYRLINMKVCVGDIKWNLYSKFPAIANAVTSKYDNTRIHVCRNRTEKKEHTHCVSHCENSLFLYAHFSAMKWREYDEDETFLKIYGNRIDVCFATHCSRSELVYFKNYLAPKRTVGFPGAFQSDSPVKNVCDSMVYSPKKKKTRPNFSGNGGKVDKSVLKDIFG